MRLIHLVWDDIVVCFACLIISMRRVRGLMCFVCPMPFDVLVCLLFEVCDDRV